MKEVSFTNLFESLDRRLQEEAGRTAQGPAHSSDADGTAIQRHMHSYAVTEDMNGFKRMQMCRQALEALDRYIIPPYMCICSMRSSYCHHMQTWLEPLLSSKAVS